MSGKPTTWSECRWVMKCAVIEPSGILRWNSRMLEPRPKSKISRSGPASISVEALKLDSRGVGVPVPSSVTFISAAPAETDHSVAARRSLKPDLTRIGRFLKQFPNVSLVSLLR
jgi:hypothetical protein